MTLYHEPGHQEWLPVTAFWEEVEVLDGGSIPQCGLASPSWGNQTLQHLCSSNPAGSVTHPKPLRVSRSSGHRNKEVVATCARSRALGGESKIMLVSCSYPS